MKKRTIKTQLQQGFSLVEVIVAAAILSTVTVGASSFQSAMMQKTIRNNDKSFASEKALQMYDEMRSFVQSNQESFITSLDNFSDGNGYSWSLTTSAGSVENPADPLSGNEKISSKWRFIRQIQVDPVLNDDYSRQVRVKVWRANPNDQTKPMGQPLAAISGILKTNVDQYPPTQVYDVFMFGAENAPAWWVEIAALRPTFERLLDDLEYRNPGLRYRRHYVSRFGFGRDPYYLPYMNSASNTDSQTIPWTYFYPGRIQRTNAGMPVVESYVEEYTHGRRRNDDPDQFTHASRALTGASAQYRHYAMADRFNHVKRYPENRAMLNRLRAIDPNTEIDLVTYLEEMNSEPDEYRNSLIINLHGELIPFPAIRNYSDPAKRPDSHPNIRVVTHPERIRYNNTDTDMRLRVHAYQTLPYGQEKLDGDQLDASTESNANNAANQAFMLDPKNHLDKISVFIPTDGNGRNPFDPSAPGFLDHPVANVPSADILDNIMPSKIIGNHRRPYVRKDYITSTYLGFFSGSTGSSRSLSIENRRLVYRKTSDQNAVGQPRTVEIARDPRLPSDVSFVRGGISETVPLANLLNGSRDELRFSFNDFMFLSTSAPFDTRLLTDAQHVQRTINELIDQTIVLDPDVYDPRQTGTSAYQHRGLNLEMRVQSARISGNDVYLRFYTDSNTQNAWQSRIDTYLANLPSNRLNYARDAVVFPAGVTPSLSFASDPVTSLLSEVNNATLRSATSGNRHVLTSNSGAAASSPAPGNILNIGTRVVLKRDFEIASGPQVFGSTVRGIHLTLLDTPTRHMQKEGNNVFPVWPANGSNADYVGRYTGLFHTRGDNNTNAHQTGNTRRLDRLEYVPAPVSNQGTSTVADDFTSDLTSSNQTDAKNTARWVINTNLSGLNAVTTNAFANDMLTVETRIGTITDNSLVDAQDYPASVSAPQLSWLLQQGQSEDGDLYRPNSSGAATENTTVMRDNLYNVSRTFVWTGAPDADYNTALENANVPYVERRQYLGDPRYMPYADLKAIHTYNRQFYQDSNNRRGFAGLSQANGNMGGYNGYDRHNGPAWGGVDADLNWYFQLYTNGIMRSNSIYNSVTGYSNYYHALGGEMGADANSANFQMRRQPWSEGDEGNANRVNTDGNWGNEITGTNLRMPMSTENTTADGTSNSQPTDNRWVANPFHAELFPDEDYNFWRDNGNLPNRSYDSSLTFTGLTSETSTLGSESNLNHRFWRARYNENPLRLSRRELRMAGTGASSFMNGSDDPVGSINAGFNHTGGSTGNLTKETGEAGRRLADAFNLALPNTLSADRPFQLRGSGGSGGYGHPDMQALRNRLTYVNSATGVRSGTPLPTNIYYDSNNGGNWVSSAVVELSRDGAGNEGLKGSVLMNGFARAQVGGDQTIARLSQAGSLQAYMDSGDTTIPGNRVGRTVQIPRVEITSPKSAIITGSSATVKFDVSWLRWDGEKYSQAYPDNWRDSTPLVFNAKYFDAKALNPRTGEPGVWIYVNTSDKASEKMDADDLSYYDLSHELFPSSSPEVMSTGTLEKTFSWDVSALDDGNYKLRVETYRDNFRQTGYTYHDIYVTIKR